jgi:hypothetical protein
MLSRFRRNRSEALYNPGILSTLRRRDFEGCEPGQSVRLEPPCRRTLRSRHFKISAREKSGQTELPRASRQRPGNQADSIPIYRGPPTELCSASTHHMPAHSSGDGAKGGDAPRNHTTALPRGTNPRESAENAIHFALATNGFQFHSKSGSVYASGGINDVRPRLASSPSNFSLTHLSSLTYSI